MRQLRGITRPGGQAISWQAANTYEPSDGGSMGRRDHAYDDRYDEGTAEPWETRHERAGRLDLVRPAEAHMDLVTPHEFDDAQTIADRMREDGLVIVDLRECSPALAGRLTDFCAGLVYALDGGLQLVADGVLLLAPGHVDVSGDEAAAVRERAFFNRL
jgi:FtsZ-interacting cell division protein YlmF